MPEPRDGTDAIQPTPFTPYGRGDARALAITADDERMLSGEPQPLQARVPATAER